MRKHLAIVTILTIASQLAALLKLWFTARIFGVSAELDGYNLSLVLPVLIGGVMAGVLQTGFFPVRARLNAEGDEKSLIEFERSVLVGVGLLGFIITFLLMIGSPFVIESLTHSAPGTVKSALASAYPVVIFLVLLNFVGDCCNYLLAMRNHFAIAAAAPIINGLIGAMMLALWPDGGLDILIASTMIGMVFQVGITLLGLKATGFVFFGALPSWTVTREHWYGMLTLGAWILPGVIFSNLLVSLPTVWAAKYGEGAVSAFGYAYRLHSSAIQLLVIASSTIFLAEFSNLVAHRNVGKVKEILAKVTVLSIVIGAFSLLGIWLLGEEILETLFGGGEFDSDAVTRVSSHWLLMSVAIPFAIIGNVYAKLWQAQKRPQLISVMAAISLLSFSLASYAMSPFLKEYSLSLAIAVSAFSVVMTGMWFLKSIK